MPIKKTAKVKSKAEPVKAEPVKAEPVKAEPKSSHKPKNLVEIGDKVIFSDQEGVVTACIKSLKDVENDSLEILTNNNELHLVKRRSVKKV